MSDQAVRAAVAGGDDDGMQTSDIDRIGKMAHRLEEIGDIFAKARTEDQALAADERNALRTEQAQLAADLTALKKEREDDKADDTAKAALDFAKSYRTPSKANLIGTMADPNAVRGYDKGSFLYAVHEANGRDSERQADGKGILRDLADHWRKSGDTGSDSGRIGLAKAAQFEEAWGKSTLGTTDAAGGWVIPNAIVDEFIVPATFRNIYRDLMTVVPGVTAATIDIPFRSAIRSRAAIAAFGATKENVDLAYNGYTATMYTLARIYDIGNQFLRQSRGAAERDVLTELAAAFAQGESYYIREGSGSSQPFGYTSALTNGPGTFRSSFTPSAATLAGSILTSVATAAGALAARGVQPSAAVLSASVYWQMASQGLDGTGFFYAPAAGPAAIRPGTLLSPWGLPVYPDTDADVEGTAAVIDNLVVADWKAFKVYFGESYRVDSSDQAGTRWDTNLTGFRGEEEMGFDARPAVYAGYAQMITDVTP